MKNVRTWKTTFLAGAVIALAASTLACNNNPVVISPGGDSPIGRSFQTGQTDRPQVDILWVIDDSGSMAEEQYGLRYNFEKFIDTINSLKLDAHIAVTTTNTPIAVKLGLHKDKLSPDFSKRGMFVDKASGQYRDGVPIEKDDFKLYWEQAWACAGKQHKSLDADQAWNGLKAAGNKQQFIDDNFPDPEKNKVFAKNKFLDTADSTMFPHDAQGALTSQGIANLRLAFSCLSMVGLDGNFIETGIGAAVDALDPNGVNAAVLPKFIRKDAKFILVIVSDENDCSRHDIKVYNPTSGQDEEFKTSDAICSAFCDLFNTKDGVPPEFPNMLDDPKESAQKLLDNLAALKGKGQSGFDKGDVLAFSVGGPNVPETLQTTPLNFSVAPQWQDMMGSPGSDQGKLVRWNFANGFLKGGIGSIQCPAIGQPVELCADHAVCSYGSYSKNASETSNLCTGSGLPSKHGTATSSNRYAEFVSQFPLHYPSADEAKKPVDSIICTEDFDLFFKKLSKMVKTLVQRQCIKVDELKAACEGKSVGASCQGNGTCKHIPGTTSDMYCSSLVQIVLTAPDKTAGEKLKSLKVGGGGSGELYCKQGSYGTLAGLPYSCILNPDLYSYAACTGGMKFTYNDLGQAIKDLRGIKTEVQYTSL